MRRPSAASVKDTLSRASSSTTSFRCRKHTGLGLKEEWELKAIVDLGLDATRRKSSKQKKTEGEEEQAAGPAPDFMRSSQLSILQWTSSSLDQPASPSSPSSESTSFSSACSSVNDDADALDESSLDERVEEKHRAVPLREHTLLACNVGDSLLLGKFQKSATGIGICRRQDRVSFRTKPTCHDFWGGTGDERALMVVGFRSGECAIIDPLVDRDIVLMVYNEGGSVCDAGVTAIRTVPPMGRANAPANGDASGPTQSSPSLFVAAFDNGEILTFDRTRKVEVPLRFVGEGILPEGNSMASAAAALMHELQASSIGLATNTRSANPSQGWLVSRGYTITDMAFAPMKHVRGDFGLGSRSKPQHRSLALAARDGTLRVVNYDTAKLIMGFRSWFGALLCLDWSPDGRYIVTGGEDDSVCLWSIAEGTAVFRGEAHGSWVSGVAFDPWGCHTPLLRFTSVGEDARLGIWEYREDGEEEAHSLSPPNKSHPSKPGHRRVASESELTSQKEMAQDSQLHQRRLSTPLTQLNACTGRIAPPMKRHATPRGEPLYCKQLVPLPLCKVACIRTGFVTLCEEGLLKLWQRPFVPPVGPTDLLAQFSSLGKDISNMGEASPLGDGRLEIDVEAPQGVASLLRQDSASHSVGVLLTPLASVSESFTSNRRPQQYEGAEGPTPFSVAAGIGLAHSGLEKYSTPGTPIDQGPGSPGNSKRAHKEKTRKESRLASASSFSP